MMLGFSVMELSCSPPQCIKTGFPEPDFYLLRLKPDLSLDNTFGTNGKTSTPSSGRLLQQPGGSIFVVGTTQTARYFP